MHKHSQTGQFSGERVAYVYVCACMYESRTLNKVLRCVTNGEQMEGLSDVELINKLPRQVFVEHLLCTLLISMVSCI